MNKKMKPVSECEFVRRVTKSIQNKSDFCLDNMGQLVLYTGFYLWSDNTIHDNEEFHPDHDNQMDIQHQQSRQSHYYTILLRE